MNNQFNFIFITQDDPFYVRCFFEEFFKAYSNPKEIQAVVIQKPLGKKSTWGLMKQMYAFYGSVDFFRMGFRYLKTKAFSKMSQILPRREWFHLEELCRVYNIEVIHQNGIHQAEFLDTLRQKNLDLIISVAASSVFKQELIDIPQLGCINIHHAPLPRYRGMLPNFWQLYHGEKTVGLTIHKINPRIDEGEIILQKEIPVESGESLDHLIKRTKRLGAHSMIEAIEVLKKGNARYQPNRPEEGSYFSFPTKQDVRKFRAMGHKLL